MKLRSFAILIVLFAVGAAPVVAQGLADSTRPIGSERSETKGMVIDNSSLTKASRTTRVATAGNWILDTAAECVESVKELNIVLTETATGDVFFDEDWRRRVEDSANRFRLAESDFLMIDPDPRYNQSFDRMESAVELAESAVAALLNTFEINQPLYTTPKKELLDVERTLELAYAQLRADHRAELASEPAPPIDPIKADQSINTLCGQRYGAGSGNFSDCVESQKTAITAITMRTSPDYRLDSATFNTIRNNCRFEYPDNYAGRNRCEEQHMAAKGSR